VLLGDNQSSSDLIQQWLELVVVVFVDQRDMDVGMSCQSSRAVQASESPADNDDVFHWHTLCEPPLAF
jgi:hypothetical protein